MLALVAPGAAPPTGMDDATAADGRIRTQLVAAHDVQISSEIAAKIAHMPLRAGDAFAKGQVLATFDCARYRAQQKKARASAVAAAKQLQVTQRLARLHSVGALDVEQAQAHAKEADADAAYMRSTIDACRIRAPFAGRVVKREADAFEYVTPGKPLLEILDTSHLDVKLIVPSRWLKWVKPGTRFSVHVDDLDIDVPAEVRRIGASVDPVSRTVTLTGRVRGKHPQLLSGMSGWAHFQGHP